MTAEELRDRLFASAERMGWPHEEVPSFVSPQFRGRPDASTAPLPQEAFGIRLGAYPAIVAPVTLGTSAEMQEALKLLHSQMVIARSYMTRTELINAHIFICAVNPSPKADWRSVIDIAERDEAVCRKLVWLPDAKKLNTSYEAFRDRTFLAAPWELAVERRDAALDRVQGLAANLLVEAGLDEETASKWIDIVNQPDQDEDTMVERLVRARGDLQ
ncbi:hypothetical protein B5V01_10995 [Mesorhizobium erdmanii]|uniref:Uncharacterized protein n=2 Tax=Mesorhizobium TaxID=68287 RepID=A0A3M9XDH8_9HYPH|nr:MULTISPECIES: ABC-three component system middle component 1 [Mesorhizobium]RNJ45816.1 hypothetical protein DNR46_10140 [Mesorhizobium japonicum]RXT47122.1 hypothetical protein B5V01_10995 [Mesorhizobium erdmanii]